MKKVIIAILFIIPSLTIGQNKIILTEIKSGKRIIINEGERIGYTSTDSKPIKGGIITKIKDSTIQVKNKLIKLNDLTYIGHRKLGTTALCMLTSAMSGIVLGYFALPENHTKTIRMLGTVASVSLFITCLHIGNKNSLKRLNKKWKLTIEI